MDSGRWRPLCRAAETGRRVAADVLLDELRGVLERGTAEDRKIALDELLLAGPRLWLSLDRYARAGTARRAAGGRAEPARALPPDADPLRLVLASFDADGRLRQAAVERLARRSGRFAVAALALRTDDWVPAVRDPARAALLAHVAPDEAASAVRLLSRLGARSRSGGVLEEYRAVLREPERRRTVRRLAAEPDPHARRFGMGLALELGEYVRGDLARAALHDRDQECRRLCARQLLDLDPDQAGRLMWARSAAVRELAVAALPDDVPAVRLVAPLADRSRLVRAQARWKLYKRGEPPVDVYRRQLRRCGRSTHPRLVAGLAAGLGECGDVSDLPALAVLARDDSWPAVARRAAVRAIGLLAAGTAPRSGPERGAAVTGTDGGAAAGALAELAGDPVPSVAREALDALAVTWTATPAVLACAVRRPEPAVWRAALRASRTLEYFDRLELLLGAAADARPEVAARACEALCEWRRLRWSGGSVEPDRVERLGTRLRGAGLAEDQHAPLDFLLRALGRRR
ncbi:hypothetical protein POF50_013725 [Streptomyces sp. SL13]|uniref:HEAT repeat domain-containing protein n=1 Tax=Streptantibioticus silvisoli TaxID=2705255 RepID=A0AA90GZC7_9ACTN|nr:hypothetical protein [Streptantibioticus silvisoli]MDI5970389.1 hypothetical protein [Streptantibioticus silvisoli]